MYWIWLGDQYLVLIQLDFSISDKIGVSTIEEKKYIKRCHNLSKVIFA